MSREACRVTYVPPSQNHLFANHLLVALSPSPYGGSLKSSWFRSQGAFFWFGSQGQKLNLAMVVHFGGKRCGTWLL